MSAAPTAPRQALLLVPGLLNDARLWQHQLTALADVADMQVADHTRYDNLYEIAAGILAAAPPRFALAGLSMGGYVAFEMLRQAPQRITRLALINTAARDDSPERRQRRLDFMTLATRGRFLGVSRALLPQLIDHSRLDDEALATTITAMGRDAGVEVFLRQQRAIIDRPDSRPLLSAICCPLLLIGGLQDQLTPPQCQREIAEAVPGARLLLLERCGHLAPLEQPEAVNAALRLWLQQPAR